MKPGEAARFACEECQVVFDLSVAPASQWAEQTEDDGGMELGEPTHCPFCESAN